MAWRGLCNDGSGPPFMHMQSCMWITVGVVSTHTEAPHELGYGAAGPLKLRGWAVREEWSRASQAGRLGIGAVG